MIQQKICYGDMAAGIPVNEVIYLLMYIIIKEEGKFYPVAKIKCFLKELFSLELPAAFTEMEIAPVMVKLSRP